MVIAGSPGNEAGRVDDERQHEVSLNQGFYLQTARVTREQWKTVMGENPSKFKNCGENCPVEFVSWKKVQGFIKKMNGQETTRRYRLPTEAEWEYACRAGTATAYSFGSDADALTDHAWYNGNSDCLSCHDFILPIMIGS
jgi:formylglycine-generating enzyme required for sulfatase activity